MALDLSKLNFFSRLDARARVAVLFAAIIGAIFLVYLATKWVSGGAGGTGSSSLAAAPQGLQSAPGGQLTPEYYRALAQSNAKAAERAKATGTSAVPTLLNTGVPVTSGTSGPSSGGASQCNIICSDESANVKYLLDDWVKQGRLSPDDAAALEQLAAKNVSVGEYGEQLNRLMKQGKLAPDQARELLAQYKKQHGNALLQESAKSMDSLIKAGAIPLDVANQLLTNQKDDMSLADYAAGLQQLTAEGKISPETAQQLLSQYTQQRAREARQEGLAWLHGLAQAGELSPDVEATLAGLQSKDVPVDQLATQLQQLVAAGKLAPVVADRILKKYQAQKAAAGPAGVSRGQIQQQAEDQFNAGMRNLIASGKMASEAATQLSSVAEQNIPPEQYAAVVRNLIASGKVSADAAPALTNDYQNLDKARMTNTGSAAYAAQQAEQQGNATLNDLVTTGKASSETAAQLNALARRNVTPEEYAKAVNDLITAQKLPPEVGQRLTSDYQNLSQARAAAVRAGDLQEIAKQAEQQQNATLNRLLGSGGAPAQAAMSQLSQLARQDVPADQYAAAVNDLVAQRKISSEAAQQLINGYQTVKQARVNAVQAGGMGQVVRQAKEDYDQSLNDGIQSGKVTADAATQLRSLAQQGVTPEQYAATVSDLVTKGKVSAAAAQALINDYSDLKQKNTLAENLVALQGNNASPSAYAGELKRAVQAGLISPDQAQQLAKDYQTMAATPGVTGFIPAGGSVASSTIVPASIPGRFSPVIASPAPSKGEFAATKNKNAQQAAQEEQARIGTIMNGMANQAGQLVSSWQPSIMVHRQGEGISPAASQGGADGAAGAASGSSSDKKPAGPPVIKAGTIIFAVLDTQANSDYPDSPVLATVVEGQYKGAKLMGKLVTTKGVSGQLDRIMLNFTLMNYDPWQNSKSITAYGVDPDSARTALASNVDYHYMQRFGAIMATSFLQGYGQAVTTSGSTATTGIFGTSSQYPSLSPTQKIASALGQMGQTLGNATQNYVNIPPTVKVDSGASLGILFMSDVAAS